MLLCTCPIPRCHTLLPFCWGKQLLHCLWVMPTTWPSTSRQQWSHSFTSIQWCIYRIICITALFAGLHIWHCIVYAEVVCVSRCVSALVISCIYLSDNCLTAAQAPGTQVGSEILLLTHTTVEGSLYMQFPHLELWDTSEQFPVEWDMFHQDIKAYFTLFPFWPLYERDFENSSVWSLTLTIYWLQACLLAILMLLVCPCCTIPRCSGCTTLSALCLQSLCLISVGRWVIFD